MEELILSIPLPERALFHRILSRGYISHYTPQGKNWLFCLLGNTICRLRPLDAVLSSGLCGKEGALPPVTGLTGQRIICC